MIRLVFVSTLAYNYFFPGEIKQAGGHTRIFSLAKAFALRPDYDVFCITGDFGQKDRLKKDGVTLIKAPIDKPLSFINVILTVHKIKPDVLVDLCASPRLFLYYLLKKSTGLKYVFLTAHDIDVNGEYKRIENRLYYYFYLIGLKNADKVVAQVPLHKELLFKRYKIKSTLVLSPYLTLTKKEKPSPSIILWVGRAAHYKRPELFVQLAQCFPSHKFVMICNASSYDRGFIKSVKDGKNIPDNLEFHEYVPYPAMISFYEQAKFLVNTSDAEGFPNTFIEAAATQTPVLSLNSNPNHMLTEHAAGYACGGSTDILKARCHRMLIDSEETQEAGRKAFDYAYKYHRLERAVDQFNHIFKTIAD